MFEFLTQTLKSVSIGSILTGSKFNEIYKGLKFYKFLNDELNHRGFRYGLGLNVDSIPFNPTNQCSAGGLYFCKDSDCHLHCMCYGNKLALVRIPDDAKVYVEYCKFKADKLIIDDITDFHNVSDDFWINILQKNGHALKHIKIQTEKLCKSAVQQNGLALQYVKDQTIEICKLAIQQDGRALQYVNKEFQIELCKLAVYEYGLALHYIKEPTGEIRILVTRQ